MMIAAERDDAKIQQLEAVGGGELGQRALRIAGGLEVAVIAWEGA